MKKLNIYNTLYEYNDNQYILVNKLKVGYGYWIKAKNNCHMTILNYDNFKNINKSLGLLKNCLYEKEITLFVSIVTYNYI